MKIKTLLLCSFVLLGLSTVTFGQNNVKLYTLIIASPEVSIERGVNATISSLSQGFEALDDTQLQVDNHVLKQKDFSKKNVLSNLSKIPKDKYDGAIIYYIGNAYESMHQTKPTLNFDLQGIRKDQTMLELDDIYQALIKKDIGSIAIIAEVPNNYLNGSIQMVNAPFTQTAINHRIVEEKRFEELYETSNKTINLGIAYLHDNNVSISGSSGGRLAEALLSTLNEIGQSTSTVTWSDFENIFSENIQNANSSNIYLTPYINFTKKYQKQDKIELPNRPEKKQIGIIQLIASSIRDNKFKKAWKQALDDEKPCDFFTNSPSERLEQWEKEFPAAFNALKLSMTMECPPEETPDEIFKMRKSTLNIWSSGNQTAKDDKIFDMINRKASNSNNELAKEINQRKGYWNWLNHYQIEAENDRKIELEDLTADREKWEEMRSSNNQKINQLEDKLDEIKILKRAAINEKDNLQKEIELIDQQKTEVANFTVKIPNFISNEEMNEFIKAVECIIDNGQSPELCTQNLSDTLAKSISKAEGCSTMLAKANDSIGVANPTQRKVMFEQLFPILMYQLKSMSNPHLQTLTIEATFTGMADYRKGSNGYIRPKLIPTNIEEYYINQYEDSIICVLDSGRYSITNENFAFLRAYYAYQMVETALLNISNNQINIANRDKHLITFKTKEQKDKNDGNADDFRGAAIDICIPNLFDYLITQKAALNDRLIGLNNTISEVDRSLRNINDEIEKLERENGKINKRIDKIRIQEEKIKALLSDG